MSVTGEFIKSEKLIMYTFDYLVFIGVFSHFIWHICKRLKLHYNKVTMSILALGSAQMERNIKNPFLAIEREQMILSNFSLDEQKRIHFVHVVDVYNDEKWVKQVKTLVNGNSAELQKLV
jgi:nicotinamide mononucleotide adenylyltransferase